MKKILLLSHLFLLLWALPSFAGEADVVKVKVDKESKTTYRFDVTVLHQDTGWEHYADQWEVLDQKGTVLGKRVLEHPHEDEQPFTRSLSGVKIPQGINTVQVRAHDSVHEYGGKIISVKLP